MSTLRADFSTHHDLISTSLSYIFNKPTEFYRSIIKTHSLKQSFSRKQIKERVKITFTCERHGNLGCVQRNYTSFHFNPTFLPFSNKVFALREMDQADGSGEAAWLDFREEFWEFREIYQLIVPPRSDKDSRFPDRIDDRIDPQSAYPTLPRMTLHTLLVDSFTADLSPRLLGNCLGRGGRAQARVLPALRRSPTREWGLSIYISQALFDGRVVGTPHNRVPTSNYQ